MKRLFIFRFRAAKKQVKNWFRHAKSGRHKKLRFHLDTQDLPPYTQFLFKKGISYQRISNSFNGGAI